MAVLLWGGLFYMGPELAGRLSYASEKGRQKAISENFPALKQADGLSVLLREVVRTVKPAVVEIRVSRKTRSSRSMRFPTGAGGSVGSGVIIDRENGYVVTNEHVVRAPDDVKVILADGRELGAEWVRSDWMVDLAVIKISPERLLDIPMGDSSKMEVGDHVLAVGSPMKLPQTVTFGRISAKGRMIGRSAKYQKFLQTDAAINQGNSGGPLINMSGEIIGINTAIVSDSGTNAGLGMSIPSNIVKRVVKQLIEGGKAIRGFIGLGFKPVGDKIVTELGLPHTKGALVEIVVIDGPADVAGVEDNDFIVSIGDKPIANSQELRHIVADIAPGTTVPVELYRDGELQILSVKIAVQPENLFRTPRP